MRCLLLFCLMAMAQVCFAQYVEQVYPKTLWVQSDTFYLRYDDDPRLDTFTVSTKRMSSPGTDAMLNSSMTILFGKDSVRTRYHNNLPYAHVVFFNVASPKGKNVFRIHFNDVASFFTKEYMKENYGKSRFDIPEAYELANIIWTISPAGQKDTTLYKAGPYYERVMDHFKPYMDHPIFKQLNFPDSIYYEKYYDFRENSFAFNFKPGSTKLLFNGPYYYVFGNNFSDSSLFGLLRPLVEDFAAKSRFREFYKSNLSFYQKEISREQQLMPLKQMWDWLEKEFVNPKYQSYRVVFSPLIGGSHSTQNYATYNEAMGRAFRENVMFVCGPERYDTVAGFTDKQREGMMSGIVFTEIDHNYVNPATGKYRKTVDSIFSKRDVWVRAGISSNYYRGAESVFNEYMTHAVFCLWVLNNYDKATADLVIDRREVMNVDRRNFIKFREFNRELMRLRQEHSNLKVVELYPYILEWCKKQIQ